MDDDLSDDDALQDIRNGGRRGFVVLYQHYEPDVHSLCDPQRCAPIRPK